MANEEKNVPEHAETVETVKGFDNNLQCRGFQFEIGKTYEHDGDVEVCESGFHACAYPLDVLVYYPPAQSRYAVTTQGGKLSKHNGDSKIASAKITIGVELHLHDLIQRAVKWVFNHATSENTSSATGYGGASSATGYGGASSATGYGGASSATGYRGASSATGYRGASSATGDGGASSATGYGGASSATGDGGASSATGDGGASSATGYRGASSATGDGGASSATGYGGASSATGEHSAAMAIGHNGKVLGANGCALFLVYRDQDTSEIKHAWSGIVGRAGIEPNVWYTLNSAGQPEVP